MNEFSSAKNTAEVRKETDSLGEVEVPARCFGEHKRSAPLNTSASESA